MNHHHINKVSIVWTINNMNFFFCWLGVEGFSIREEDTRYTLVYVCVTSDIPKDFPGPRSGELFLKF